MNRDKEAAIDKLVEERSLPSTNKKEVMTTFQFDDSKSVDENASNLMELKASERALEDNDFIQNVADIKKEQIKESAKVNKEIHIAKKEAEMVDASTEVDRAFFEKWKTVLKFGGIKEPTTKGFSIFMLTLVLPFYIVLTICIIMPFSVLREFLEAFNRLFEEINKFGKIGRGIAFSILILGALALVAFIAYSVLLKYGIIDFIG